MHSYRSNIEHLCVCVSLEVFSVRTECPCPVSDSESVLNVRAQCTYTFSVLSVRAQCPYCTLSLCLVRTFLTRSPHRVTIFASHAPSAFSSLSSWGREERDRESARARERERERVSVREEKKRVSYNLGSNVSWLPSKDLSIVVMDAHLYIADSFEQQEVMLRQHNSSSNFRCSKLSYNTDKEEDCQMQCKPITKTYFANCRT